MALKKLVFIGLGTVALSTSAFAAASYSSNSGSDFGRNNYIQLSGIYSKVTPVTESAGILDDVDKILATIGTSTQTNGGFGFSLGTGHLIPLNDKFDLGLGVDYTYYAPSTNDMTVNGTVDGITANYDSKDTVNASGIDLLIPVKYHLNAQTNLVVSPGFQYAMDKITINHVGQYKVGTAAAVAIPLKDSSYNNSALVPEFKVGVDYNLSPTTPISLTANYQYVFGNDDQKLTDHISSRQAFMLGLQYAFGAVNITGK